jgi:hypothetical protein
MKTIFPWHSVNRKPGNSREVLITDGKSIMLAHWFAKPLKPQTHKQLPGRWANRTRMGDGNWIDDDKITHWMDPEDLL